MKSAFSQHLAKALVTLMAVFTLTFIVGRMIPGDPIELLVGETASAVDTDAIRESYHLNANALEQYFFYLRQLGNGDLGKSITRAQPVTKLIGESFGPTLLLAVISIFFSTLLAIAGVAATYLSPSFILKKTVSIIALILLCVPSFWLGPVLISCFSLNWPWLPPGGTESWLGVLLPSLCLSLLVSAYSFKILRSSVLKTVSLPFVSAARAKGASEARVFFHHILPNSLSALVPSLALSIGFILGGAPILESIFRWPGMGTLAFEAILARDYPVLQGVTLVSAITFVVANLAADLIAEHFLLRRK